MTGGEYADLIAQYILFNFGDRHIKVYREVPLGKSIIGKNRRIDILVVCEHTNQAFAIECKYQASIGTVDEKIPYAIEDMRALRMEGCIVYAGEGFSVGVLHMLQASELACSCYPNPENLTASKSSRELDHLLAMHFTWWDILVGQKQPIERSVRDENQKII